MQFSISLFCFAKTKLRGISRDTLLCSQLFIRRQMLNSKQAKFNYCVVYIHCRRGRRCARVCLCMPFLVLARVSSWNSKQYVNSENIGSSSLCICERIYTIESSYCTLECVRAVELWKRFAQWITFDLYREISEYMYFCVPCICRGNWLYNSILQRKDRASGAAKRDRIV